MQGIELVVFDFDQTLINSQKGFEVALEKIVEMFVISLKSNERKVETKPLASTLERKMMELDAQKQYNRDLWWNLLLEEAGYSNYKFNEEQCKSLTELYWETTVNHSELYPDTIEILDYLKA